MFLWTNKTLFMTSPSFLVETNILILNAGIYLHFFTSQRILTMRIRPSKHLWGALFLSLLAKSSVSGLSFLHEMKKLCRTTAFIGCVLLSSDSHAMASDSVSTTGIHSHGNRYWDVMNMGTPEERIQANTALMDMVVGTVNTMYYDHSSGAYFQPREFFQLWKQYAKEHPLDSRESVVTGLKYLVSSLNDPYSKYLTREELKAELVTKDEGFLYSGAQVEWPNQRYSQPMREDVPIKDKKSYISTKQARNLPIVTAVAPNSRAERAGIIVGDRIVAVGEGGVEHNFLQQLPVSIDRFRKVKDNSITIARPIYAEDDIVVAFRPTRVNLMPILENGKASSRVMGNDFVQYALMTPDDSIFDDDLTEPVGYIRLTRFSKAATTGYLEAMNTLESKGAKALVVDLRNCYGGVIQEAMLMASSLLRDPHSVLCFTMNSRGGFTPHDVEEYVVDKRYMGYIWSREPKMVTYEQVKKENPDYLLDDGIRWKPPSAYASLHEQQLQRGIRRASYTNKEDIARLPLKIRQQLTAQKKIVILINEGTASAAEVFASALHDNGRILALVGTKSFGKGLIQHTFPLPDGGGLRLSVAEYLTPSLHHVSNVGGAQFDPKTGNWIGGGLQPDVLCSSRSGIPSNIGADLCVGVALDVIKEAEAPR